jgi:putative transposase
MPRRPRNTAAWLARHVVQRGNNKVPTFSEFQDYHLFLQYVRECLARSECLLHAYVLMTNHFHLMITPTADCGISRFMQLLGAKYVRYYNERHGRTGTLWQGRYKAAVVNSDAYILSCMRYIELNPVRAGMVAHARDYRWSSYRANAGERRDDILTPHSMYDELSPDLFDRGRQYARWVATRGEDPAIEVIRAATNRCQGVRVD